jgi:hypothetical protein
MAAFDAQQDGDPAAGAGFANILSRGGKEGRRDEDRFGGERLRFGRAPA